ncbi:MAG: hypothetical protein ABI559_08840 [Chloroflexota bacterium]
MKRTLLIVAVITAAAIGLAGIVGVAAGGGGGGSSTGGNIVGDLAEHLLGSGGGGNGSRCRLLGMASGVVADSLGITQAELQTELQGGKSVAEVAQAHGVNASDFSATLLQKANARVTQGVADGSLTQARADELIQFLQNSPDVVLNFQLAPGESLPCASGSFGADGDEDDQPSPIVTPPAAIP